MTVRVGFGRRSLQVDTHDLFIGEIAGVYLQFIQWIAVLISLDYELIPLPVCLQTLQCRLIVGNVVGYRLVSEFAVGDTLAVGLALTLQRCYPLFKFSLVKQICLRGPRNGNLQNMQYIEKKGSSRKSGARERRKSVKFGV